MPSEAEILQTIDSIYEARVAAQKERLIGHLAPGATYVLSGDSSRVKSVAMGPTDAGEAISGLIDTFRFHSAERRDSIVQGNRAAVVMRVDVSSGGGEPVTTEFVDLWEFDEDGKARSLRQFIDTALAAALVE